MVHGDGGGVKVVSEQEGGSGGATPSDWVDNVWHEHMVHTRYLYQSIDHMIHMIHTRS